MLVKSFGLGGTGCWSLILKLDFDDETIDHLENLHKTKSLQDEALYNYLHAKIETLGKKINLFIKGVDGTDWE